MKLYSILFERFPPNFDVDSFIETPPEEQTKYVKTTLKDRFLGLGSGREVFQINDDEVLKISRERNIKGIKQNRTEIILHQKYPTVTAKIIAYDTINQNWLVAELVKPFNSEAEFKQTTGIGFDLVKLLISKFVAGTSLEDLKNSKNTGENLLYKKFELSNWLTQAEELEAFVLKEKMYVEDLLVFAHWGRNAEGNAVLMDYGLNNKTVKRYYKDKPQDQAGV